MTAGGKQDGDNQSKARTWNGRYVHIAHRRTSSELTPLIQQNLALQQQVEMLTAQNAMMQQQTAAGSGSQLLPPPPVFHQRHQSTQSGLQSPSNGYQSSHQSNHQGPPGSPQHARQRSMGHARRHSLAVSEAKKYAQERTTGPGTPNQLQSAAFPPFGSPGPIETPQFRFPPSPDRSRGHSRSQSMSSFRKQTPSPQRFQFPPQNQSNAGHANANHSVSHANHANNASYHLRTGSGHLRTGSGQFSHARTQSAQFRQHNDRKLLFVPYLPQSAIPEMLAEGLLVTGTLRVNHKNRSYAYVSTDLLDAEVLIDGSKDRNRALEGDVVAVELLNVDDVWAQKQEKEERKRRRDNFSDEPEPAGLRRRGSLKQRTVQKRHDDVEVEGQTLLLRDELLLGDEKPLYCGHVVAILERPAGQLFSGTLGLLRPSSQATKDRQLHSRTSSSVEPQQQGTGEEVITVAPVSAVAQTPKIVWFKPTDKCVPLMAIPTEQAPADLVSDPQNYAHKIFVGQIKRWPITSLHPFGTLVESLGPSNDLGVAQKAILREFNFGQPVFTETASVEAKLAAEAMSQRAQSAVLYPHKAVKLAPDLAASLNGDTLAVHVLDITPFIARNGQLDRELRHKSAGVYMAPLNGEPGFSSPLLTGIELGTLSPVLTVEIGLESTFVRVKKHAVEATTGDVEQFAAAASVLRRRRQLGSIDDAGIDLSSLLDVAVPVRAPLSEPSRSELIINEIVHAANSAVASELLRSKEIGLNAIVRRQSEPAISRLEQFAGLLRAVGVRVDTSSSQALARSLAEELPARKAVAVKAMLAKLLARQRYAVAARTDPGQLGHYWFGFDAYTHFARPLLRYADQVVARQVHAMLNDGLNTNDLGIPGDLVSLEPAEEAQFDAETPSTPTQLAGPFTSSSQQPALPSVPDYAHLTPELSFRYDCARGIQEQSVHLAVSHELSTEYTLVSGIVVAVHESSFDVVVPELSVEKRVHGDQLPLAKAEFHAEEHKLELFWTEGADAAQFQTEGGLPQPKIPEELRGELLLKPGCVQEIVPLCEVPVLIRVSWGERVLPSLMVKAANPFCN